MNARRKPRIFADHKPPLVAFVLVAFTTMMLLVHVARSDAAPAWFRHGVSSVMAGGAPLGQQVLTSTVLERTPVVRAAEPPVLAPELTSAEPAPDASASSDSSDPARGPRAHGPTHQHAQVAAGHAGPALTEPTTSPDPSDEPDPSETPSEPSHGYGPRGNGYGYGHHGNAYGHEEQGADDQGDEQGDDQGDDHGDDQGESDEPGRGDGAAEGGQHPWYDDGDRDDTWPGHGHGWGHENHGQHGHGQHGQHRHHGHGWGHGRH